MTDELPQTAGDAIILALTKKTDCFRVFVPDDINEGFSIQWKGNAAEQLEAAIEDLGYRITKK